MKGQKAPKTDLLKFHNPVVSGQNPEDKRPAHVAKRKRAHNGAEVVFDPAGHKAFLTGFSKRKKQRRKEGMKQLEKLEKEDRRDQRSERRRVKKAQMQQRTDENLQLEMSDEEGDGAPKRKASEEVKVYNSGATTTTVITSAIHNSSSESEAEGGDDNEDGTPATKTMFVPGGKHPVVKKRSKILAKMKEKSKPKQPGFRNSSGLAKRKGAGKKGEKDGGGGKGGKGKGGKGKGKGKGGKR